ncbi:MAG: TonB-dependent receptor-like protein [Caulobacteraceae bacterium]|nr:TonB-dependent receptor-like protein [Caulobacteraceae bacterium]
MSRAFGLMIGGAALALLSGMAQAAETAPGESDRVSVVTVTASPLSGEGAAVVGRVGRDDILAAGGANLADALGDVPGVSGTGFASGASRPVIRGMDSYRVKVLENGLSSGDVSDIGPDHGVPIDPLTTDSIEVVRGAATLRYGGQAIGGVVNAINGRIPTALPDAAFGGEAVVASDTADKAGERAARIEGAAGDFVWRLDGSRRQTSDYDTPLGRQVNSAFKGSTYAAGGSYILTDGGHVGLSAEHYDATYGVPSDITHIDMRQSRYSLGSDLHLGSAQLTIDAGYVDYSHNEVDPSGVVGSTFANHEWDGRAELVLGPLGPLQATAVGVQLNRRDFSGLGEAADFLLPTHTNTGAAFAFTRIPLSPTLDIEAAGRLEQVKVSGTPATGIYTQRQFKPFSGSAGLVWRPSDDWKLGLTVSDTGRAPAQAELFAHGPHDGPQTFETGDPALKTERAQSAELNARWSHGAVRLEGSVWSSAFKNYVYGALTGRTCDDAGACAFGPPDEDLRELNYAQSSARFRGAEVKASVPLGGSGLSLNLMADTVRASLAGALGPVPRLPPHRLGAGLAWAGARLDASLMWIRSADQDRPGLGDTPTPGFDDLDAQIAWRPLKANDRLEITLAGHNLTDAKQRNAAALNKDLVLQQGRDVRVAVRMRF